MKWGKQLRTGWRGGWKTMSSTKSTSEMKELENFKETQIKKGNALGFYPCYYTCSVFLLSWGSDLYGACCSTLLTQKPHFHPGSLSVQCFTSTRDCIAVTGHDSPPQYAHSFSQQCSTSISCKFSLGCCFGQWEPVCLLVFSVPRSSTLLAHT